MRSFAVSIKFWKKKIVTKLKMLKNKLKLLSRKKQLFVNCRYNFKFLINSLKMVYCCLLLNISLKIVCFCCTYPSVRRFVITSTSYNYNYDCWFDYQRDIRYPFFNILIFLLHSYGELCGFEFTKSLKLYIGSCNILFIV